MMDRPTCDDKFRVRDHHHLPPHHLHQEVMDDWFMRHYDDYVERCSVASVSAYGASSSVTFI